MVFFYTLVTQTSNVVTKSGFGSAGAAGTVLALFTVGGVLGGILFRRFTGLSKWVFTVTFACMGVGFLIMALSGSLGMLIVGEMLTGIGFGLYSPAKNITVGFLVADTERTRAASILSICGNIGGFLSAFLLSALANLLGISDCRFMFWCSVAFYLLAALLTPVLHMTGLSEGKPIQQRDCQEEKDQTQPAEKAL